MALLFTAKPENTSSTKLPVDLASVTPHRLQGMSMDQIANLTALRGNRPTRLDSIFNIEGCLDADKRIEFHGSLEFCDGIGAQLDGGTIEAFASVGHNAARNMSAGTLIVRGNVGNHLASQMTGGQVRIEGNAGSHAAAAHATSKTGMRGGEVVIAGSVGRMAGARMRGGLLAIGGDAEDYLGQNMLAGTIVLSGSCGQCPGQSMVRGTLLMLNQSAQAELPIGWQRNCQTSAASLNVLFKRLQQLQIEFANTEPATRWDSFSGDLSTGGRGEILIVAP